MLDPNQTIFAICLYILLYNTDWIANMEIGLDPSNSYKEVEVSNLDLSSLSEGEKYDSFKITTTQGLRIK